MKIHKRIGASLLSILLISGGIFTSCDNDINIGQDDADKYLPNTNTTAFVVNEAGRGETGLTELRKESHTMLRLKLNHAATEAIKATFTYNEEELTKYNTINGTDFELFPETMVQIENLGVTTLEKGKKESSEVKTTITSDGTLDPKKTYVIPFSVAIESEKNSLTNTETNYFVFVKEMTKVGDPAKYVIGDDGQSRRVEVISCMEMGDTNPLNNLSFTLKNSGKPLVDVLVMFSGNIKFNETEGRVYLAINNPIQYVLDNHSEFIQPLKDRGIKVVMSIMPHHDWASLTALSDETAKAFVQELKAYIDAYDLDGVFWDEEYSIYEDANAGRPTQAPFPGFVRFNTNQASLIHEFNRVMPDKYSMVYAYSKLYSLGQFGGKTSGQYVTHALNDYPATAGMSSRFPGLPTTGWGVYSKEFNLIRGGSYSNSEITAMRNNGYCTMIFAMDPYRSSYNGFQLPNMKTLAKDLFKDELVVGDFYKKEY